MILPPKWIRIEAAENGYIVEVREQSDNPEDWEGESRYYVAQSTEECLTIVGDVVKELREEL